ncbi:alpha/beta fold hydrolase [Synechococcus sp. UW179A]|uniref:alpha/beta fold hydrolase n=1 Tax=Synechococcus sp. UW179A TaxID=2575510 RepID=UPI001483C51A|nr:alpha/beta hydrolase [Synechococcus sp. UW179A]
MLPGWSQSAVLFRDQFSGLSEHVRCIALDHRGHGESDKAEHGYRVDKLARDLQEFISFCGFKGVIILGHSMGASVIWSYLNSFSDEAISGIVIVDQPAALTLPDYEPSELLRKSGAIFSWEVLNHTCSSLIGSNGIEFSKNMILNMLSDEISNADREWILKENFKFPRHHAATLLFNACVQDWRDTISMIKLPALIIGGEKSIVPPDSQRWIQSQIEGSRLQIFSSDQGGYHFAFLENPEKFNLVVRQFVDELKGSSDCYA